MTGADPQPGTAPRGAAAFVCRGLLLLYPRAYRREFGSGIVDMFAEAWGAVRRSHGPMGMAFFLMREWTGLVAAAVRLRTNTVSVRISRRRAVRAPLTSTRTGDMTTYIAELSTAVRRLIRSPGFTFATVTSLGLGIGANAAIFSVVYGVVLRPLPFPQPDRLVSLEHRATARATVTELGQSFGTYGHYRASSELLEDIAIYRGFSVTITGDAAPERVDAANVSYTLFDVLQTQPVVGRVIRELDDRPDSPSVGVISHALWVRRFGSDPDIIGRNMSINGFDVEVIGVMPAHFSIPTRETQVWLPYGVDFAQRGFGGFFLDGIGRLRPGASPDDLERELQRLIPGLADVYPQVAGLIESAGLRAVVTPLKEHMIGGMRQTLWILLATVAVVLLIACANVANLFLVRAEGRHREVALRAALGASAGRIAGFFLAEGVVLAAAGTVVGLALAYLGVAAMAQFGFGHIPRFEEVGMHLPVLAFTAAVAALAGIFFGLVPLARFRPAALVASLKDGAKGTGMGRERHRTRNLLVATQIALAMVLLVGSGLMAKTFWRMKQITPGFDAANVLTMQLALPGAEYPTRPDAAAFYQQLLDQLEDLPGVSAAGAIACLPLNGCSWTNSNPMAEADRPPAADEVPPSVFVNTTAPGFFRAMGTSLVAGRTFTPADHRQQSGAAVISQALAERFWPGEDPLGKRVYPDATAPGQDAWYTVVGVVGSIRSQDLTDDPPPMLYLPMVGTAGGQQWWTVHTMSLVIRTDGPPLALLTPVRNTIRTLNPNLAVALVSTMDDVLSDATARTEFTMALLGIAAAFALFLGALGLYGVISYVVSQRQNEIGVRIALGAQAGDVSGLVLKQGGTLALVGVGLGLGAALGLTRLMRAILFEVSPTDPLIYGSVGALLVGVALVASYVPARRAACVDPAEALRS